MIRPPMPRIPRTRPTNLSDKGMTLLQFAEYVISKARVHVPTTINTGVTVTPNQPKGAAK